MPGPEDAVIEIAAKVLPKGIAWLQAWWSGKRILILGPSRAGKTNFQKFLESDFLPPERPTPNTTEVTSGDTFTFLLGDWRKAKIPIWKPKDVPGDEDPAKHVLYVERYKPHCIVVVLDATTFFLPPKSSLVSSLEWLEAFCSSLNLSLIKDESLAKRLQLMAVIINKWDQISSPGAQGDAENRQFFEKSVRDILDKRLNNRFYRKDSPNVIEVIPCVLVRSEYKKGLADDAVKLVVSRLM